MMMMMMILTKSRYIGGGIRRRITNVGREREREREREKANI